MGTTDTTPEGAFDPERDCHMLDRVCARAPFTSLGGPCVSQCDVVCIEDALVATGIATRTEDSMEDYDPAMLRRLAGGNSPTNVKSIAPPEWPHVPKPTNTAVPIINMHVPEGGFA